MLQNQIFLDKVKFKNDNQKKGIVEHQPQALKELEESTRGQTIMEVHVVLHQPKLLKL